MAWRFSVGDLEKAPISTFFKEGVLRTLEGWIWLVASAAYLALAAMVYFVPAAVVPKAGLEPGFLLIALVWPVVSFVVFVIFCSPDFRTSVFGVAVTTVFSLMGFVMLYG